MHTNKSELDNWPVPKPAWCLVTWHKVDGGCAHRWRSFNNYGYQTALVGKAHFQPLKSTEEYPSLESTPLMQDLDYWRKFNGPFYGFNHVELARNHTDEPHVGQHYGIWMEEKGYKDWRKYFRPAHGRKSPGESWEIPEEIHYNTWIAERTNALMEQYATKDENFFLWASFFDPHPEYMVPEPYASMYETEMVTVPEHKEGEFDDKPPYFKLSQQEDPDFSYLDEPGGRGVHGAYSHLSTREEKAKNIATMYGMVTMMDKYIGTILDKLNELGLTEKTLSVLLLTMVIIGDSTALPQKQFTTMKTCLECPLLQVCQAQFLKIKNQAPSNLLLSLRRPF